MRAAVSALLLSAAPVLAEDEAAWLAKVSPRAAEIVAAAAADCAAQDGGVLEFETQALIRTDLDGDNGLAADGDFDDMVVDFNFIYCSRALSLFAGSGGAPVHFVLDGTSSAAWLGYGWQIVRLGPSLPAVILLPSHGSFCNSYGASPCVIAIVAQDGQFYTTEDGG